MRQPITGVSQIIHLGAVWPVKGRAYGPSLPVGADGGTVLVWRLERDGRRAVLLLAVDSGPDFGPLRSALQDAGWTWTEGRGRADDVASAQAVLGDMPIAARPQDERCASTGLLLTRWRETDPGRVFGAWVDESHGLFGDSIGEDAVAHEEWLHA